MDCMVYQVGILMALLLYFAIGILLALSLYKQKVPIPLVLHWLCFWLLIIVTSMLKGQASIKHEETDK